MAICRPKRFPKDKICTADLRHKVFIKLRQQRATKLGEQEAEEVFTTIASPFAAITTLRGTQRFNGINIDDRATHLFNFRYSSFLNDLDVEHGNHFIEFKNKNYRILEITNQNENNLILFFQTTERGDEDLKASDA